MAEQTANQLELSGLIKSLRAELARAQAEGDGKWINFLVEGVELELEIAAEEQAEGGIAAKFYVLTSHFKASHKNAVTQKLRLSLKPHQRVIDPDTGEAVWVPLDIGGRIKADD